MRGLQQIAPWVIHDQPDTSDTAPVLLVPVLNFHTITRSFGTFQLWDESLGQPTSQWALQSRSAATAPDIIAIQHIGVSHMTVRQQNKKD